MKINRRSFIKVTASAAGAFAVPSIVPSSVFGQNAPSSRVNIGLIGTGRRGNQLLKSALYNDNAVVVAVSDCFTSKRQRALKTIADIYSERGKAADAVAKEYADFRQLLERKDIDAVLIATPEHWHVPLAVYAINAGKDVYLEKPLGVSIDDGFRLRKLVHDKKTVFQFGTQQRSDYYFRFACELVRNGYIGKLENIDVWCLSAANHDWTKKMPPQQPVPADLDYDRWIGPAPMKPYSDARVHYFEKNHIYDYGLGFIGSWGVHPLDIAQWGNNTDHTAPIKYEGTGTIPSGGLFDTISFWDVHCEYANGVKLHFMDGETAKPVVSSYYADLKDHGTTFRGDEGWITVRRDCIDFSNEKLRRVKLTDDQVKLYKSEDHMANFIDCVKTRKTPVSTIAAAVQCDLISHLSNAAIRLNKSVEWDAATEQPAKDADKVNSIINRVARDPWKI